MGVQIPGQTTFRKLNSVFIPSSKQQLRTDLFLWRLYIRNASREFLSDKLRMRILSLDFGGQVLKVTLTLSPLCPSH